MNLSRPHTLAFVARHDAPLIGERAARRGRCATVGGDERAGVKSASSVRAPASQTGSDGGNRDAFGGCSTDGSASKHLLSVVGMCLIVRPCDDFTSVPYQPTRDDWHTEQ